MDCKAITVRMSPVLKDLEQPVERQTQPTWMTGRRRCSGSCWNSRCPEPRQLPQRKASPEPPARSGVYLIIGLQNELTKHGILKNSCDYEDFWELIQEESPGTGVKEKLRKIKWKLMSPRPQLPNASRRSEAGSLVGADQDSSTLHQETQNLLSRLTEWRRRCQQREATRRLHQGQEVNKTVCKTNKKSRSETYLSLLYQMYSTSLANMEFSRRLLEKDGRFADLYAEHRAGGLLDYMVPSGLMQQAEAPPRETGAEDPLPTGQQPRAPPALCFLKCQSPASPQRGFHQKTRGHHVVPGGMSDLPEPMKGGSAPALVAIAPLTLEHVIQTHPVLEAKTVRRYWVNYVDEE
ncbi:vesicle transport protein SFT2A isoform X2 [Nannospalax galili]|uniref:vesicle transport protein SFT2A isoform X2 n=1 Tax=Nannospalax galili TaxID=1026970 RepID=UPI0004ED1C55|nr:vesicle transport protein SFT2A isoform X2 [Nannospalax galili]